MPYLGATYIKTHIIEVFKVLIQKKKNIFSSLPNLFFPFAHDTCRNKTKSTANTCYIGKINSSATNMRLYIHQL